MAASALVSAHDFHSANNKTREQSSKNREEKVIMSSLRAGVRFVFLLFVIVLAILVSTGRCTRSIRDAGYYYMLDNRLARGPVPPSGPSPCHHSLDPYSRSESSDADDYVMCP
ncbi:hypothetical protein NC653_025203 [Populus alba x Populus x berolinensis]|uniref:Uncharacterized protein n=1 Tax=Populus alba x Populus x berolinensis TaxID=444605 RepID=A0AAD6Q7Q3_9ROSI|nr:hypothetical protein NC653_025203 [Populus alba x Populus x berolinensis]